ncbi:MAG: YigZ family protein [Chlorobi bacterium]|nr:YigZ family protein [Chlorobiota bacterium]
MENTDTYFTLSHPATGIFRDRGSRFLSFAYPARTSEECAGQLEKLRHEYRDARHHCYAYRLDPEKDICRYSDNGEPNGTAGRPVYEQILAHHLFNVHLVVVRYFGGTLLGTGGLYQAYKKAAADALSNADIIESFITKDLKLRFSYSVMNQIMQWIDREHPEIISKDFGESGNMIVRVRKSKAEDIIERLRIIPEVKINILHQE